MTEHHDDDQITRAAQLAAASEIGVLPPIFITHSDYRRLRSLAAASHGRVDGAVLDRLAHELGRAVVCGPDMVPSDVVTMNSRFFYRRHVDQPLESRTLVYDEDHSSFGATISILSPLGVALLGLREGSRMPYASLDGTRAIVALERIAYQPEGEGRLERVPYRYWPRRGADGAGVGREPTGSAGVKGGTIVPLRRRPALLPGGNDDSGPDSAA